MAVFKNFTDDELIISCKCGCDNGIHFVMNHSYPNDYCFATLINGDFYNAQKHPLREKIKKIWAIIKNKDYYYSDICMTETEFNQFVEWINNKNKVNQNLIITNMNKLAQQYPNSKIIIESNTLEITLSEANIYEDINGNIVIDNE